jgi:hypothetical protein
MRTTPICKNRSTAARTDGTANIANPTAINPTSAAHASRIGRDVVRRVETRRTTGVRG